METGKTGKYFKYAIGEIILVVIGILIALQINNWNETRLEGIQEQITLANLNEEFQDNLKDLDSINLDLLKVMNKMELLFSMFKEENSTDNIKSLDSIIGSILTSPTWKPSEFVLNDLKSSGGLSKLKSSKLKKLLFQWTRFFNQMKETEEQMENTSKDLIKFLKANGSLRNIDATAKTFNYKPSKLPINNLVLLQNPIFENHIDDKLFVLHEAKAQFVISKQLIHQILKETSAE
ncbi:DUF6090 family protein [Winogradskyella sp. PE311]|uniref:DUF6090 family protein n=1 Tax=Winogradskyella sp. PE311 TaxID=3366943 RepID=UPI00397F1724